MFPHKHGHVCGSCKSNTCMYVFPCKCAMIWDTCSCMFRDIYYLVQGVLVEVVEGFGVLSVSVREWQRRGSSSVWSDYNLYHYQWNTSLIILSRIYLWVIFVVNICNQEICSNYKILQNLINIDWKWNVI